MDSKKRVIAVIVGSDSDLKQCADGLKLLKKAEEDGMAVIFGVYTASIHRNTKIVLDLLEKLEKNGVDILITGAGWANHLSGMCDAYLRYQLLNDHINVIGVAFDDGNGKHLSAAVLSISEVPNTQVLYETREESQFSGKNGFTRACYVAVNYQMPKVNLPAIKPVHKRTIDEVIKIIQQKS